MVSKQPASNAHLYLDYRAHFLLPLQYPSDAQRATASDETQQEDHLVLRYGPYLLNELHRQFLRVFPGRCFPIL